MRTRREFFWLLQVCAWWPSACWTWGIPRRSSAKMRSTVFDPVLSRNRGVMMKRVLALAIVLWWPVQAATADDSIAKVDPAVRFALEQATDTTALRVIVTTQLPNLTALRNRIVAGG